MAEIDMCNIVNHSLSNPLLRNQNLATRLLTPQEVSRRDREGNSPLHFAATSDDSSIIKLLLNAGAGINSERIDGMTPLHMAVVAEKDENVELLLRYGAKANAKDLFGKTSLHLVACSKFNDDVTMLRIAKLILDCGLDVKILLNECSDSGETPLHYAIMKGNEDLIKLFLAYGANLNAKNRDGKSPLYFSIEFNKVNVAELLLDNGARVNDKINHGSTALHEAIIKRAEKSVELLLDYGAEVRAKDIYGKTPLHLAARLNYLDERKMDKIVKFLLDKGADVNDHTNLGETAFHCAVINGNEKLVRMFLDYGADVNTKNYDGKSPLHFAIQYSNKNIVKLLLDRGARIDDRTNDGKLALHVAVAVEDENMVKILLEYNADVNALDKCGKTPLSLAIEVAYMRSIYNPWNGFCPNDSEFGSIDNVFVLLIKHIARIERACDENLRAINMDDKMCRFYAKCLSELKKMRKNNICDNVSMDKVLTRNMDAIVAYTRNENLFEIFELDLYAYEFPIYYRILKERFDKAEHCRILLETSLPKLHTLVKPSSLPDLVANEILSYLTIEDLTNLAAT